MIKQRISITAFLTFTVLLLLATNASAAWTIETVDSVGDVGKFTSIVSDSSGYSHISYYDETNDGLKYATNASGVWVTDIIDNIGTALDATFIELDSSENVHILYNSDGLLKYATNASGVWVLETIIQQNDDINGISFALDAQDNAHLSFYDSAANSRAVRYATNKSGNWVYQEIETYQSGSSWFKAYTSIAVDSSGHIHLSYYNEYLQDLIYATNSSGSWINETVDNTYEAGRYSSIALDSSGNVHIGYSNGYRWNSSTDYLNYATNSSGQWVVETIQEYEAIHSMVYSSSYVSIALDSNDNVHITHVGVKDNSFKVQYTTGGSGSWTSYVLADAGTSVDGPNAGYSSIAVDADDNVHISYYSYVYTVLKHATDALDSDIDHDGDGYTENQGDCNDLSTIEHSGQIWYKDFDKDNYSSGETVIQCFRPGGNYMTAFELNFLSGDCDDYDSNVNPGQTEVIGNCKDDDCNESTLDGTVMNGEWQIECLAITDDHVSGIGVDISGNAHIIVPSDNDPYVPMYLTNTSSSWVNENLPYSQYRSMNQPLQVVVDEVS